MTVSRHFFRFTARAQMKYLQRCQQEAMGEDRSEVDRAKTALASFGIGYATRLRVVKADRVFSRYLVVAS